MEQLGGEGARVRTPPQIPYRLIGQVKLIKIPIFSNKP